MLAKIFSFILEIINIVILFIIRIILLAFQELDFTGFTAVFNAFFGLLTGATKMLYFLAGDTMAPIFIDIAIALWTLKHIGLPIVNFIRKVVIK